ncbi:MAG: M48 family metalloprotease [Chitinophagaceae bacterium]|mgnify:CR=1 FL=1|nr:M48 family metalloprotease [Chitinophagaceae bacterium]
MRHKFFLMISLSICVALSVNAQRVTGCGFKVPPRSVFKTKFQSVYEAKSILAAMLDSIKWKENFSVREQNGIQNAYATIINRQRWIVYDNNFLEDIDAYTSTKWASISVLAHEMGHHYYNHVVSNSGSTPPKEIEADAFSGYVMQRLGATLQQSVAAMQAIASDQASSSHPGKKDRVDAITRGWNSAKANTTTATTPNNPPPVTTNPTTPTIPTTPNPNPGNQTGTDPATDPSWIALYIQSTKNEIVQLSDDGKNFQQAEIKAGQPFVFKFEIYNYGWLRLKYYNGYRTFKLMHGKDYSILWNRRTNNWSVVEVPE